MAYDSVKRTYGLNPVPGERFRLEDSTLEGFISRRNSYDNYVWVTFDGSKQSVPCHPKSLEYLTARNAEPIHRRDGEPA